MRQRIVIAIALTANPDILICDEPTTALDVTIQAQILELINKLKKERNLSCIFITHDLGVVANMADRVAVMYAGKIVEYGKEEEIFYDPKHPYTWALLSSARTKGLTSRQAIVRHALRNAFVPILPHILAEFIGVFSGSMILESLYNINGIGDLYILALNNKDYNVLFVDMAIFTTIGLLAGIITDLSYGFIDPRIRMGEKK